MMEDWNGLSDVEAALEVNAGVRHERLSVVMPVRNALPYLDAAVESILRQTHADFEFVIGDDASDDGSTEALRAWTARDSRIRLFEGDERRGPAGSSNWVVEQATGNLVARMDADDLAHPDRLRRQLAALAARPDAVMVGSPATGIDRAGRPVHDQARYAIGVIGFGAPFAHGSIMFRRDAFENAGGYREQCAYWEDLDLYIRLERLGKILTLPDPLHFYRYSETSTRLTSRAELVEQSVALMLRCSVAHAQGEDYDSLLEDRENRTIGGRVDARVFLSISKGQIWSGVSPGMLGRMLKRARFPRSRHNLGAWAIMLWGSLSPRTARYLLGKLLARKNRRVAGRYKDGMLYEWRSQISPVLGSET